MTLFDAFFCSVSIYLATVFISRLEGSDKFKGLPFIAHFMIMLPIWMFFTFAIVCNTEEKSTAVLGTIILLCGAVAIYLFFFTDFFDS